MGKVKMLGALVGDIIGSMYEFHNTKRTDFELFPEGSRFTDDSVMTLAVAKWLLVATLTPSVLWLVPSLHAGILFLKRLQSDAIVYLQMI